MEENIPAQPQPHDVFDKKKPSRRRFLFVVILAIFIVGGLAFAYVYYYKNVRAQVLWFQSLESMQQLESFSAVSQFDISYGGDFTMQITLQNTTAQKQEGTLGFGNIVITFPANEEIPFLGTVTIQPKVSFLSPGDGNYYVRLDAFPPILFLTLDELKGKWIRFNLEELSEKYAINITGSNDQIPVAKRMHEFNKEYKIFTVSSRGTQDINGTKAQYIFLELNKENFKKFFDGIYEEQQDSLPDRIIQTAKNAAEEIDDIFLEGEVWIDPKTHNILQDSIMVRTPVVQPDEQKVELAISIQQNYSQFNEPFEITAPTQALSFEEFLAILGNSLGIDLGEQEDYTTDTDNDGLTDYSEKFYGTDINNPDSDADGYLDGEEVDNGYNPLGEGKL